MPLFPPSTNAEYRGTVGSAHFLTVASLLTIVPGCIHRFLPDGGAGTIAGLDLNQNGRVVVALFAWVGATQIAFGLAMLVVSLWYRTLVPLMLALVIVERTLHALAAWVPPKAPHHPPEHYAVLVALPLLTAALVFSLRERADVSAGQRSRGSQRGTSAR